MPQEIKMSEAQNLNHEKPFLTVVSKVTPQDAEKAARHFRTLQSMKMTVIFILVMIVMVVVVTLYHGLPLTAVGSVIAGSRMWLYIVLYILFSVIYHIWYQPRQARRALMTVYGDVPSMQTRYSLYDDQMKIEAIGIKTHYESTVNYSDIRRIRDLRYQILLRTQTHNILSINKLGLSNKDIAALLKALREKVKG